MKRHIALIFVIMLCFSIFPPTVHADTANDLTRDIRLTCEKITGNPSFLIDDNISTSITLTGNSIITIVCDTPISQLYLVWNKPPNAWELTSEDSNVTYGQYGFIHEYVKLDKPQSRITLTFHGNENILSGLYAFTGGDVPCWVEQWQPPYDEADLLLIMAHPDDELLYLDKVETVQASRDIRPQFAYMTHKWSDPNRMHQSLSNLYGAGIRAYPVISNFESTIAPFLEDIIDIYDEDAFIASNVEQIRRFKPQVIIGSGYDGDGIRQLCSETLLIAAELSGDELEYRESARKYGVFDVPKLYLGDYSRLELVRTTVGQDTVSGNDLFENIGIDSMPGSAAPPENPAAEAPPTVAAAPPAASIQPNPVANICNFNSLPTMGIISVLCLIVAALLLIKREY